jgi:hypothetical protein
MWGLFAERLSYGYLGELSIKHCLCVASDLNLCSVYCFGVVVPVMLLEDLLKAEVQEQQKFSFLYINKIDNTIFYATCYFP